MRFLNARIHGILDVITILVLALGPFLAGLGGPVALIAWTFAALHLILVLITRYPLGRFPVVPFVVHGLVEMIVGVFLLLVPVIGGYGAGSPGRRFYTIVGAFVLVVWAITAYREADRVPAV
jgi:hypothetical protein